MCARVTSTYMEFTFTFGPKLEFKNTFKCYFSFILVHIIEIPLSRTYVCVMI